MIETTESQDLIGFVASSSDTVIPPLITEVKSRGYAAFSNCLGGMPPIAVCGRSLL